MSTVQHMADFLYEHGFVEGVPVDPIWLMEHAKEAFPGATLQQLHDAAGIVARRWHAAYGRTAEVHAALTRGRLPRIN